MRHCNSCNKKISDKRSGLFCGRCIYHAKKDYNEQIVFFEEELSKLIEEIEPIRHDLAMAFSMYDFKSPKEYAEYRERTKEKRKKLNRLSTVADNMCAKLLKLRLDKAIFDYLRDK